MDIVFEWTCLTAQLFYNRFFNPIKPKAVDFAVDKEPTIHIESIVDSNIHRNIDTKSKNVGIQQLCESPLRRLQSKFPLGERDLPRHNIGPIDPPMNSCMRLVRDSYFS